MNIFLPYTLLKELSEDCSILNVKGLLSEGLVIESRVRLILLMPAFTTIIKLGELFDKETLLWEPSTKSEYVPELDVN